MGVTGMETGEIAAAVAVIAAAGLALGPYTKATIDALKSTRLVPTGYGGLAALLLGMLVGLIVGVLAAVRGDDWVWILVGALGGLFAGTNAIQIDHAATGRLPSGGGEMPKAEGSSPSGGFPEGFEMAKPEGRTAKRAVEVGAPAPDGASEERGRGLDV